MLPILYNCICETTRYQTQSFCDFSGKYIHPDAIVEGEIDAKYYEICSKHVNSTVKNFFTKMVIIMLSASTAFFGPLYAFFFEGRKVTGTGESTTNDFVFQH